MKETVLDVLMYLFENFMYNEPEEEPDRDDLQENLIDAGFSDTEISKAFDWLDGLAQQRDRIPLDGQPFDGQTVSAVRVYTVDECARLDTDCRGFLIFLEQSGVLDAERRELVIDRVMALDSEAVDLEDLKWIILMVLFSQPGQEAAYAWMENLLFDNYLDYQH